MKILLELVATLRRQEDILFGRRVRVSLWRAQRNKMLRAVAERDAQLAALEARRIGQLMKRWIAEDKAEQGVD